MEQYGSYHMTRITHQADVPALLLPLYRRFFASSMNWCLFYCTSVVLFEEETMALCGFDQQRLYFLAQKQQVISTFHDVQFLQENRSSALTALQFGLSNALVTITVWNDERYQLNAFYHQLRPHYHGGSSYTTWKKQDRYLAEMAEDLMLSETDIRKISEPVFPQEEKHWMILETRQEIILLCKKQQNNQNNRIRIFLNRSAIFSVQYSYKNNRQFPDGYLLKNYRLVLENPLDVE